MQKLPQIQTQATFVKSLLIVAAAFALSAFEKDLSRRAPRPFEAQAPNREPLTRQMERARELGRGREAVSPSHIPWKGWKNIFWRKIQSRRAKPRREICLVEDHRHAVVNWPRQLVGVVTMIVHDATGLPGLGILSSIPRARKAQRAAVRGTDGCFPSSPCVITARALKVAGSCFNGFFSSARECAPAHRRKLGDAIGSPHDLDGVGRRDVVMSLQIARGSREIVRVVDFAPRVALSEASIHYIPPGDATRPIRRGRLRPPPQFSDLRTNC